MRQPPPGARDLMIDTVQRRREYLRLMIDSHLRWIRATDDQQVKAIHRTLVDLLAMVAQEYDILLEAIHKPR